MALKNILVAYNGTESSDAALAAALHLCEKHNAHLTGLLALATTPVNVGASAWMPKEVGEMLREAKQNAAKQVEDKFLEGTSSATNQDKIHWISSNEQSDATVARYARLFDLTVVGRYEAVLDETQAALHLHPDMITMVSGRPVLLIPRNIDISSLSDHALVAWDGKRASARALGDAMQILTPESKITLATVGDGNSEINLPGTNAETALQRHDLNATTVVLEKKHFSVSKTLLEYLDESKPNLLIMGAYEHSKFRQSLIGGVTSSVLKEAKMPILISH